jgi:hypothetical protein
MAAQDLRSVDDDALSKSLGQFMTGKSGYKAAIEKPLEPRTQPTQYKDLTKENTEKPVETSQPKPQQQSNGNIKFKCPKCQKGLTGEEKFCPGCGLKIEIKMMCCGREIGKEDKFCSLCGKQVR